METVVLKPKILKPVATIDNSALQQYLQTRKKVTATLPDAQKVSAAVINPARKPLALSPAWQLSAANLAALESFVQLLQLKAYSKSTIATYRNEFIQLLKLLKDKPVDALTVEDLKRYMSYVLVKERISENTAHSRLNALKFYLNRCWVGKILLGDTAAEESTKAAQSDQ
ncbi:MAG: phage integrase N-terminal SAM-like domain-containing protein [Chitinophagaceae bacterium]|nr:phage integrase N-terminal SAM-like domain-containing protein [Chitinophagaceae bacterium]